VGADGADAGLQHHDGMSDQGHTFRTSGPLAVLLSRLSEWARVCRIGLEHLVPPPVRPRRSPTSRPRSARCKSGGRHVPRGRSDQTLDFCLLRARVLLAARHVLWAVFLKLFLRTLVRSRRAFL
jgi:hypothetical protein